jgi:hypothetical protein
MQRSSRHKVQQIGPRLKWHLTCNHQNLFSFTTTSSVETFIYVENCRGFGKFAIFPKFVKKLQFEVG